MLFDKLPKFPPALPDDELRLLQSLPSLPTMQMLEDSEHDAAASLKRRGLISVESEDNMLFAGKKTEAVIRPATA
jgi:hypothetical protein